MGGGNFIHSHQLFRNFLFIGLPCMSIGICIYNKEDRLLRLFDRPKHWVLYTITLILLSCNEMLLYSKVCDDSGVRDMFIFTLPLLLPFFYWGINNPTFGCGSILAYIGRRYSGYIYIIHVMVASQLKLYYDSNSKAYMFVFPIIVFLLSLLVSVAFVTMKEMIEKHGS